MTSPRILVVEHEADTGIGLVGRELRDSGALLVTVGPEAGREIPATLDGFDGLIVLGGTPGPTDDAVAGWLPGVRGLVAEAIADAVPYFGICLGAQILAVVAGGVVGEAAAPEVGMCELELTPAAVGDPLLGGLGGDLRALQWHFLEVLELPDGSVPLCRSDRCANQAFRVGAAAWGVQFHLEADAATATAWARPGAANPDLARAGTTAQDVIADMQAGEADLTALWAPVTRRWLGVVEARR